MKTRFLLVMMTIVIMLLISCGDKDKQTGITTTESGSITGYVTLVDGKPGVNLLVLLLESSGTTEVARDTTDDQGYYEFMDVKSGEYVVQVRVSDTEVYNLSVIVTNGNEEEVLIQTTNSSQVLSSSETLNRSSSSNANTSSVNANLSSIASKVSSSVAPVLTSSSSVSPSSSSPAALVFPTLVAKHMAKPMIASGNAHTLTIRPDSSLWTWGMNLERQLGVGSSEIYVATPAHLGSAKWIWADAGDYHSLALQADGSLWGWGNNFAGQLGQGDTLPLTTPTRIGTKTWVWVSAGGLRVGAIDNEHHLWTWGGDSLAAWSLPTWSAKIKTPTQIGTDTWNMVAASAYHYLAIRSDSSLFTWGGNQYGQLGFGDNTDRTSPTQLGTSKWIWVSAGLYTSYAIRSDSTLWAWGLNDNHQLGITPTSDQSAPIQVGSGKWTFVRGAYHSVVAISSTGSLFVWGSYTGSSIFTELSLLSWLSAGIQGGAVFGVQTSGIVQAVGENGWGQLGTGNTDNSAILVNVLLP